MGKIANEKVGESLLFFMGFGYVFGIKK